HDVGAQRVDSRRTREQEVLHGRRLEGAVVRRTNHEVRPGRGPGDAEARAERVLVDHERVAVPAKPRIDGPWSMSDLILNEHRLFVIGAAILEMEHGRRVASESIEIGNLVTEVLPHRTERGVAAGLPFVRADMRGYRAFQIDVPKAAILARRDRRRRGIRPQSRGNVARETTNVS